MAAIGFKVEKLRKKKKKKKKKKKFFCFKVGRFSGIFSGLVDVKLLLNS